MLKLSDQKPLKSWSTRQSNQITCHSIYDSNSEKYVGVLNKKHVCLWSEEESNLEDVKKHTVSLLLNLFPVKFIKHPIHSVFISNPHYSFNSREALHHCL